MCSCVVPFVAGEPDWGALQTIPLSHALWLARPDGLNAHAQICYDRERLKLKLAATESKPLARSAALTDFVHTDSALEFFISPSPGDSRYFNFEFNALGTMCLGFGPNRANSYRLLLPSYRTLFDVRPFKTAEEWGIVFSIPAAFIAVFFPGFALHSGLTLRGNFYKCGDETPQPHYLAWSPVAAATPDFHRPDCFGELRLG